MSEDNNSVGSHHGFGNNNRYPYYYGQGGRLVLVDNALEAVNKGSTTIGLKTPEFALITSHIKPTLPLVDPNEKIFVIFPALFVSAPGWHLRQLLWWQNGHLSTPSPSTHLLTPRLLL